MFGFSKEDVKKKLSMKGKNDQFMKTFEQKTNRRINDVCGLGQSREDKQNKINFKKFVEELQKPNLK